MRINLFVMFSRQSYSVLRLRQPIMRVLAKASRKLLLCSDHSSPSSAEVKNGGAVTPLPPMFLWHIS
jgi:hypothetical protein